MQFAFERVKDVGERNAEGSYFPYNNLSNIKSREMDA
jgi:hypothetical protein